MKVAILTWLHNGNYGSILQAYALQRFLRNEQHEVQNIDFNPTVLEKVRNLICQRNSLALFAEKRATFEAIKACREPNMLKLRDRKFLSFLRENFNLTKEIRRYSSLKSLDGKYDVYICGSDQIWSPILLSPSYYFSFLSEQCRMVAYACSFGVSWISPSKRKKIANYIRRFSAVSVREIQGAEIVKELIDQSVTINADPTLLLTKEEWDEIASNRLFDEPYMLCYFLSYSEKHWLKSKKIAKDHNLKIIVIPVTKENYNCDEIVLCDVGPKDWISLIKYASIIATDSFHGCVFSILYSKNIVVFKRFSDNNAVSQNSRIYTLLSIYGLEKCLVDNIETFMLPSITTEEYVAINLKVENIASDSKKWLFKVLKEENEKSCL